MPKLSQELIQSNYKEWKKSNSNKSFGYMMNEVYNLNDKNLSNETDENIALLMLLKDHVYKK